MHGLAEVGVRDVTAQTRILRSQLIPRHAADCVSRDRLMDDGDTPDQRRCGAAMSQDSETPSGGIWQVTACQTSRREQCNVRRKPQDAALCLRVPPREIPCGNLPHARWREAEHENCDNDGAREMGSRVPCNVYLSSLAIETGSTESGETCCT